MIDTHCHLDAAEFEADRPLVMASALAAGVSRVLVPAVTVDGFSKVEKCLADYPACAIAYGIHPLYVMAAADNDLATLQQWLARRQALAVGEIGLDYYVGGIDPARQAWFFSEQLKLARQFELPVLLHGRRAVDQVLMHLRRHPVRGGIAHAFNGSRQQADIFIGMGFKLGFGGALTFSGSKRIRALAATLPLSSLVLETDAPDMAPAWLMGGRNQPAELARIAQALAELRGISLVEVVQQTSANARSVIAGL